MTKRYADTHEALQTAAEMFADGTAVAVELAENAAHSAAAWAENAPGQVKGVWDGVVRNFSDVVFPQRSRKRRKRVWLIGVTAAAVVVISITVATRRRKDNASQANLATAAE